ncbi:hypothetical protein [Campylobacter curvus]|uniref:hypothetical protein n=1 Tax=Campylobacter curvus TaxID=200 RepID=UPI0003816020|nr:hypothetical protein [Campylobacter curvus]QKF62139.1 hypothetical protein CCVT_1900 [Campylobacter curvus]UEB50426.1 hypothetical protein LK426_02940 [Campylobacter curvus]
MSKKKVVKTAPIIEQFVDLASTQRELADELGAKFLEFCNSYLNEKCVIARSEFNYQNSFMPASLAIEAYTKKPTSYMSSVSACIGNVSFELSYDAQGEEYDDDYFKDELVKFLNK